LREGIETLMAFRNPLLLEAWDYWEGVSGWLLMVFAPLSGAVTLREIRSQLSDVEIVDIFSGLAELIDWAKQQNCFFTFQPDRIFVRRQPFNFAYLPMPVSYQSLSRVHTQAGTLKSDFRYISPEEAKGYPRNAASSYFSLGSVLFETLSGQEAFAGGSSFETLTRLIAGSSPTIENADIAPEMRQLFGDLMQPEADKRLADSANFQERLWKALSGDAQKPQLARTNGLPLLSENRASFGAILGGTLGKSEARLPIPAAQPLPKSMEDETEVPIIERLDEELPAQEQTDTPKLGTASRSPAPQVFQPSSARLKSPVGELPSAAPPPMEQKENWQDPITFDLEHELQDAISALHEDENIISIKQPAIQHSDPFSISAEEALFGQELEGASEEQKQSQQWPDISTLDCLDDYNPLKPSDLDLMLDRSEEPVPTPDCDDAELSDFDFAPVEVERTDVTAIPQPPKGRMQPKMGKILPSSAPLRSDEVYSDPILSASNELPSHYSPPPSSSLQSSHIDAIRPGSMPVAHAPSTPHRSQLPSGSGGFSVVMPEPHQVSSSQAPFAPDYATPSGRIYKADEMDADPAEITGEIVMPLAKKRRGFNIFAPKAASYPEEQAIERLLPPQADFIQDKYLEEDLTQTSPQEREVKVLRRKGVVRHFTQMNPRKIFPLLVSIIEAELYIKIPDLPGVKQVESQKVMEIKESSPYVRLVPVLPGCIVTPPEAVVDVRKPKVDVEFWVSPQAEGDLRRSARIEIWHDGIVKDSISIPCTIRTQTLTKISSFCSVFSSITGAFFEAYLGGNNQTNAATAGAPADPSFAADLAKQFVALLSSSGLWIGGFFLLTALLCYLWLKPKRGDVIEKFLSTDLH
jgi:hypothetical protein